MPCKFVLVYIYIYIYCVAASDRLFLYFAEMDFFSFINQPDLFKVTTGERTLQEGEKTLRQETVSRVVQPSENIVRLVEHTVVQEVEDAKKKKKVGKRKVTIDVPEKTARKRLSSLALKDAAARSGTFFFLESMSHYDIVSSRCCIEGCFPCVSGVAG